MPRAGGCFQRRILENLQTGFKPLHHPRRLSLFPVSSGNFPRDVTPSRRASAERRERHPGFDSLLDTSRDSRAAKTLHALPGVISRSSLFKLPTLCHLIAPIVLGCDARLLIVYAQLLISGFTIDMDITAYKYRGDLVCSRLRLRRLAHCDGYDDISLLLSHVA